ncbi:hypothetical protein WMY93_005633 [Mugilogobius chulae]|uniref:LRRCT domain-containing protein n=1 Tax=Mugilogobius chulae TaxID=88201 RepID=A0AAW0PWU2_9GOBI
MTAAVVIFFILVRAESKRNFKCPSGCSCSKETIVCVGATQIPRTIPSDTNSLSIVNGSIVEITEAMFALMPSLQLLLLNGNALTTIRDDAFSGLPHLEYLFIEGNKIESITKNAFRGLRDLTHLDLRGNSFQCNCENKWLMVWLKNTNATVSEVMCAGPTDMKSKRLNDLPLAPGQCMSTGHLRGLGFHPNYNSCTVMEWDHIEMKFRRKSVVGCKSVLIDNHVLIIITQLFGGSHIYKFDAQQNKFTKFQTIEVFNISKPNDIEVFQIDKEWYFVIVDSSKAGLSTVYKWNDEPDRNDTGFYTYQFLHEWFRDTDAEYVQVDGKSYLILASRSQSPVIYLWNKSTLKFIVHSEIPNVDDAVAIKAFRLEDDLFLAVTCYVGDSKVLKWTNKLFSEVQPLPSRALWFCSLSALQIDTTWLWAVTTRSPKYFCGMQMQRCLKSLRIFMCSHLDPFWQ